jgi:dihydroflavonol-4-reductase
MKLVTGATGLVGSHLMVQLSNKGAEIKAMKRSGSDMHLIEKVFSLYALQPKKQLEAIHWVDADLTDITVLEELMEDVDEIYHCAAIVSFHPSMRRLMLLTNVNGTANLVNAAVHKGDIAFCHVSSIAALGRSENQEMITEENLWKNSESNSIYSVSKYGAEREVWRGVAEGLSAVIVNPAVILGPGNWKSGSSELFSMVWKGLKFYTSGTTGYVDVRDVASAMVTLMENKIYGQRFILSAENLSYRQLFTWIAQSLGKKEPTVHVKPWMAEIAWRLIALKGFFQMNPWLMEIACRLIAVKGFFQRETPAITRETARTSLVKKSYSSNKLEKAIGFKFIPIQKSINDISKIFLRDHTS